MSHNNTNVAASGNESLRKKSNRLFNYQQSHKSEMPTPPTPRQRRSERVTNSVKDRKKRISHAHDNNREGLLSFGFTKNATPSTHRPCSFTSTVSEQAEILTSQSDCINKEISMSLTSIAETREKFTKEINNVLKLSANKENMHEAFSKLCSLMQSSNEKIWSLQESTQQNLLKLLALHKDNEISNLRRDLEITSNSNRIQSIETKMACASDLNKIWITFTCNKELEQLKSNTNLIVEAKNILKRMNINVDKFAMIPIRTARLQHIKVGKDYICTLCITFTQDKFASIVRRQIMEFNVALEEENKLSDMRYNERIFWSKDVFKLLKICWELKRVQLVDFANVHAEGIRVVYKIQKDGHLVTESSNITNFADLDMLRRTINDIHSDVSTTILYDDDYFKLQYHERDERRSGEVFTEAVDDMEI
jgi:hypothetical protein